MKKFTLVFSLLPGLLFLACQNTPAPTEQKTFIYGKVKGDKGDTITLSTFTDRWSATTGEEGNFTLEVPVKKPAYLILRTGKNHIPVYIEPGDSLVLSLDETQSAFSGAREKENAYLASLPTRPWMEDEFQKKLFICDEALFIQRLDSIAESENKNLASGGFRSPYFSEMEDKRVRYGLAQLRLQYPSYHPHFAGLDSFEVSNGFYSFLDELDMNDSNLVALGSFLDFMWEYLDYRAMKLLQDPNSSEEYFRHFSNAAGEVKNAHARGALLEKMLHRYLMYLPMERLDHWMSVYRETKPATAALEELEKKYTQWSLLAEGKPAPGFRYVDIKGDSVSLADLKGKYIYIDVWATWCGPCRRELPHLEKLQESLKRQNIVFMSVSVDKDREAWEKMVAEKKMKGLQLYAGKDAGISKDYMIAGIPRFMIINPEGKIVSANAERPSGNIEKTLRELLGLEI